MFRSSEVKFERRWPRAIGLFRGADPEEGFGLRLAKWDDVADGGTLAGGAVGLAPCAEVGRFFQQVFHASFTVEGDGERLAGIDQPDGLGRLGVAAVVIGCAGVPWLRLGSPLSPGVLGGFVRFLFPKMTSVGQGGHQGRIGSYGFAAGVEFEGEVNLIAGLLRFVVGPKPKGNRPGRVPPGKSHLRGDCLSSVNAQPARSTSCWL